MTQTSSPWDGILLGDAANAPYSSDEWAHLWAMLSNAGSQFPNYGILRGTGGSAFDPLYVSAPGAANVNVNIGAALVNGKLYETDAAVTLAVGANSSGNPRIDTVILRGDYTAQTVRPIIKQGTPAVSPVRPTLTQSATLWEIPLADIAVANGFSVLTSVDIADRRRAVQVSQMGWQPFAYTAMHIPNGAYNTGAIGLQGIAAPLFIAGNMLVKQLIAVAAGTSGPVLPKWGIYVEHTNDGVSGEKTLRYVGGKINPTNLITTWAVGNNTVIADAPFLLTPGSYWLAIDFGQVLSIPSITMSTLDAATNKSYSTAGATGIGVSTIDLTANFTKSALSFGLRLEGIVFGQAVAF